jgi:type IV pilus assembly protein PilY1
MPPASGPGATLAVVDARTGALLWRAGATGDPHADLEVAALHRSLPAAPRVLDVDGDGLHDRLYVLDVAGQLLRFDFAQDASSRAAVAARRVADLGSPEGTERPRRFQATPDAVLERRQGRDVLALAFGSGWASRPRSIGTEDRFYVVFDALGASANVAALTEPDLADVTDGTPPGPDSPGWMFRLLAHGDGEKVTGNSLTFDHRVRFTTYQPRPAGGDAPCGPPAGTARLYTLDIRDGSPVNHIGGQPVPDEELDVEGLAPALSVSFPATVAAAPCTGPACRRQPVALLGGESIPLDFRNDPVRTSWRQLDADAE